jgi:UDP-N-acetylmuramate dehydrogenase
VRSARGRRRYDASSSLLCRLVLWLISKRHARNPQRELNRVADLHTNVKSQLREIPLEGRVEIHERVDLRLWTVLRIGGLADLLIRCGSVFGVEQVLGVLASHGLSWLVLGGGSRIVPSDAGLRVPVIHLTGEMAGWEVDLDGLSAGAGAKLAQVGGTVARAGLAGMEGFFGLSGSVGGAVRSAIGGDFRELRGLLEWVDIVRPGREPERIERSQLTDLKHELPATDLRSVVVGARFGLREDSPSAVKARIGAGGRRAPGAWPRAAAPVFVDPPTGAAEDLLEVSGCKGLSVGGARVAEFSVNAIVTTRTTSASELAELCRLMRQRVVERSGVTLASALHFVDEQGRRNRR